MISTAISDYFTELLQNYKQEKGIKYLNDIHMLYLINDGNDICMINNSGFIEETDDEESEKDLEEKLNDFLSDFDGEIVDIKFQVSVSIFSEEQIYCFSAMIMYK